MKKRSKKFSDPDPAPGPSPAIAKQKRGLQYAVRAKACCQACMVVDVRTPSFS